MTTKRKTSEFDHVIMPDLTRIVEVLPNALRHMICGGSGDIYKANLNELGASRLVAMKVPRIHGQGCPQETVVKFLREVVLWSTLKHPHIIPFLGVTFHGQNMEIPTAVMPWYENGSLDKYLPICRDAERLSFILQVGSAVQHLHLLEIAHGDIKAQNVLISSEHPPRALLTDFGLSRPLNGVPGFETSHVQGTLHFMAPELLRHLVFIGLPADRQCTKETDIWAFGMFIVQAYTSRLPLTLPPDRRTEFELARLIVLEGYLPSPDDASEVPSEIWKSGLLHKCWADKARRRISIQALIQDLNNI